MKSMRYVVIGIGKYGSRIALEMAGRGAEVFAIDCVEERVEQVADDVAIAITMDSTDAKALRSQKLEEMDAAVVAIGENFEATVLTTLNLMDLGIPRVIVRASGRDQERILRKLGVEEILAPETEFAGIVAERLMNPNLRGFLELPDDYEIAEIKAPTGCVGRTLGDIDLTNRYELRLITIRRTYSEQGEDAGTPHRHSPTGHHGAGNGHARRVRYPWATSTGCSRSTNEGHGSDLLADRPGRILRPRPAVATPRDSHTSRPAPTPHWASGRSNASPDPRNGRPPCPSG